jgi:cysteine-rich repeat protein
VLSGAELCDGELASVTCASYGLIGALSCTAACEVDKTTCSGCGNDQIDDIEECDGSDLGGQTCMGDGTLTCTEMCTIDRSQCFVCGDGVLAKSEECDDNNTTSGDGCDATCVIEQPAGCELSGFYAIPSFSSFSVDGDTTGATAAAVKPACALVEGGAVLFGLRPAVSGYLTLTIPREQAELGAVLALRTNCASTVGELACHDSEIAGNGFFDKGGEVVSAYVEANQTVYALVQGSDKTEAGAFSMQVSLAQGTCEDPVPITLWPGGPTKLYGVTTGAAVSCASSGTQGPLVVYEVTRAAQTPGTIGALLEPVAFDGVLEIRSNCGEFGTCANGGLNGVEKAAVSGVNPGEPKLVIVSATSQPPAPSTYYLSLDGVAF